MLAWDNRKVICPLRCRRPFWRKPWYCGSSTVCDSSIRTKGHLTFLWSPLAQSPCGCWTSDCSDCVRCLWAHLFQKQINGSLSKICQIQWKSSQLLRCHFWLVIKRQLIGDIWGTIILGTVQPRVIHSGQMRMSFTKLRYLIYTAPKSRLFNWLFCSPTNYFLPLYCSWHHVWNESVEYKNDGSPLC